MKRQFLLFTAVLFCGTVFAQKNYTDDQLKIITDSILKEGELLYKLEKSAWWMTDFAKEEKKIANSNGGYFSYASNDTIKCIIYNKKRTKVIAEAGFIDAFSKPEYVNTESRDATEFERKSFDIRSKIIDSLVNPIYELEVRKNFSYNAILIPQDNGYRFYLILGSNVGRVIPFGGDYLFNSDNNGVITSFCKIHPKLIATSTRGVNGEFQDTISHSHGAEIPFITATDICTFLLYGKMYNISALSIYSSVLNLTFKYYWKPNIISIVK